jgi:plasmid stability protein
MASLSVRGIDDEVYRRLRLRAAENGVSMEEEVRRIIRLSVMAPVRLGELAVDCFGSAHGVELAVPAHKPHDPVDLG